MHTASLWLLLSLAALLEAASATTLVWRVDTQGGYVTALCAGVGGQVWVGTEDRGVWRYDPGAAAGAQWRQFTTRDGLGDDHAYALAGDAQGRLWVGHQRHGVSVYNGREWRCYGPAAGPLSERCYQILPRPDGRVWLAGNLGVSCYQAAIGRWAHWTRAEGLRSDEVTALAEWSDGRLLLGTGCHGVQVGLTGGVVGAGEDSGRLPQGTGLPSAQINGLLVGRNGACYVATPNGLGYSADQGRTWRFRRGPDWAAKLPRPAAGQTRPAPVVDGDLLLEDYVTCLAEDADGLLWLGHRQWAYEVLDPATWRRVHSFDAEPGRKPVKADATYGRLPGDYVTAILPRPAAPPLIGWYGAPGLTAAGGPVPRHRDAATPLPGTPAGLPTPAAAPLAADLAAMAARVRSPGRQWSAGQAAYLRDDWATQGDWVGRYGRQLAVLCAVQAPLDQHIGLGGEFQVRPRLGLEARAGDSVRYWLHWLRTDDPRTLYSPVLGYRRPADWDDHGETYPAAVTGPDLWVKLQAPAGVYRVSLYFFNKDGHDGLNRNRDYLVDLLPYSTDLAGVAQSAPLARTRVRDFWGGVYKQFVVAGPGRWWLRVQRQHSLNAILQGVFFDRLAGPEARTDELPLAWMGNTTYAPPAAAAPAGLRTPATALWATLDSGWGRPEALPAQVPGRLLAYRAALADGAPPDVLAGWRWRLPLWTSADRAGFNAAMAQAWAAVARQNPDWAQRAGAASAPAGGRAGKKP